MAQFSIFRIAVMIMFLFAICSITFYLSDVKTFSKSIYIRPAMRTNFAAKRKSTHKTTKCAAIERLKGLVLAINFNSPHFKVVPQLRAYYEPIFGKVIFCGEKKNDTLGVIQIEENKGRQGYVCVLTAMKMYPGYTGYIHSNDDVLINWWKLIDFNLKKIWLSSKLDYIGGYVFTREPPPGWSWWRAYNTAALCKKTFYLAKEMLQTSKHTNIPSKRLLSQYYNNTKNIELCLASYVDFFYIPQEFVASYIIFAELFAREKVFLEAAVATIFAFFTNQTNHKIVSGLYLPEIYGYSKIYESGEAFYRSYSVELDILHPFKLDGPMNLANQNIFKNVIIKYGDMLRSDC